jgi:ribosome biogenesis GTPase A
MIQDYSSIEDLCKKIGKSLKLFGKGGMIDVSKVRNKILSEWFQGKLNKFITPLSQ